MKLNSNCKISPQYANSKKVTFDSCSGYLTSNVVFKEVLVKGRVQKIILLTIKTNYSFSLSVTHVSEETKSWYSNR